MVWMIENSANVHTVPGVGSGEMLKKTRYCGSTRRRTSRIDTGEYEIVKVSDLKVAKERMQ
jgi:hypothetical protein